MEFIKKPVDLKNPKTLATLVGTVIILLALPLTVYVSLQQREIRSRAAELPLAKFIGLGGGGFEIEGLISIGTNKDGDPVKRLFTAVECGGIRMSDNEGVSWREASNGIPVGGNIQRLWKKDLSLSNNTIFVGMDGYILRSIDNGDLWTKVNIANSPIKRPFADFAAKDDNTYFAVEGNRRAMYSAYEGSVWNAYNTASSAKIWNSLDGGKTWSSGAQVATPDLDGQYPDLPSIYRDGTNGYLYVAVAYPPRKPPNDNVITSGGVLRSTDGGLSWDPFNQGMSETPVGTESSTPLIGRRLSADPNNSKILYLTLGADKDKDPKSRIFKRDLSNDSNEWVDISSSSSLPIDTNPNDNKDTNRDLFDIAVSKTGKLYVANFNSTDGLGGIYRLLNETTGDWGHLTKYNVPKGTPGYMEQGWMADVVDYSAKPSGAAISIDPEDENIMYFTTPFRDQIFRTADGGASWHQIYSNLTNPSEIDKAKKLWTNRGMGLVGAHAIAVDPNNSNKIFLGYGDWGTAVSVNGVDNWRRVMTNLGHYSDVNKILIDPDNSQNIWHVAGFREANYPKYGVYYSSDGGDSFNPIGGTTGVGVNSLPGGYVLDIAMDTTTSSPVNHRTVYVVVEGKGVINGVTTGGVYKRINQTDNWIKIDGSNLPDTKSLNWPLRTIAFDPGNGVRPKAIYVGFERNDPNLQTVTGGVYKGTETVLGTYTWAIVPGTAGKSVARGMAVNPYTGDLYFGAGDPQGGLYRFRYVDSTLEPRLAIDNKIQGLSLVAATARENDVVYFSGDQKLPLAKWDGITGKPTTLMGHLPAAVYTRGSGVAYDEKTDTLYASMACAGAYKIEDVNPGPTVIITSPTSGATISGTVDITANAIDSAVITKVEFYVDDSTKIGEDTTAPYLTSWNTASVGDGPHNLTAKAYDAVGYSGTSPPISIIVDNLPGRIGDLDGDGDVDIFDLSTLISSWGATSGPADINNDSTVDVFDLSILLSNWGT